MKNMVLILALILSVKGYSEIKVLPILSNSYLFEMSTEDFELSDIKIKKVPTKIEIIEDKYCGYDDFCSDYEKVLETAEAVVITMDYYDSNHDEESSGNSAVAFQIPLDQVPSEDLAELRELTKKVPLFQKFKQAKARKAWLKNRLQPEISVIIKAESVVDWKKSTYCYTSDDGYTDSDCEENYVYKKVNVKYQVVSVAF